MPAAVLGTRVATLAHWVVCRAASRAFWNSARYAWNRAARIAGETVTAMVS
ncbi:hypothetical protein D9M70_603510 [compost metagenome]